MNSGNAFSLTLDGPQSKPHFENYSTMPFRALVFGPSSARLSAPVGRTPD
jgi:hypothetical protein